MTDVRILQLSDLHFAADPVPEPSPARAVELAAEAIHRDFGDVPFVLALSGDITTQGRKIGYFDALRSLATLKEVLNISHVVTCPGNHDIAISDPSAFREFNQFALTATRDSAQYWQPDHPVSIASIDGYSILLVNSAFQGDHRFGSVPLKHLRDAFQATDGTHRVVMLHHSPISSAYAGGGLSDAYDLLALTSEFTTSAVLHGHVHSDQGLHIGPNMTLLFGAGSLGFKPDPNMNNQFVVHEFEDGKAVSTHLYKYFASFQRFKKDA